VWACVSDVVNDLGFLLVIASLLNAPAVFVPRLLHKREDCDLGFGAAHKPHVGKLLLKLVHAQAHEVGKTGHENSIKSHHVRDQAWGPIVHHHPLDGMRLWRRTGFVNVQETLVPNLGEELAQTRNVPLPGGLGQLRHSHPLPRIHERDWACLAILAPCTRSIDLRTRAHTSESQQHVATLMPQRINNSRGTSRHVR
jgi:hypothetical protein